MSTQITIIPKYDETGLEAALARASGRSGELGALLGKAGTLVAHDASTYAALGAVLTETRGIRRQIAAEFAPFRAMIERVREFLRTEQQRLENMAETIDGICRVKLKAYEAQERAAAAAEEKKLNQKVANPVNVQPNLPPISG